MNTSAQASPSTIVHCLRYRDAYAAIDFLVTAFGFERHAVYDGPDNTVAHAQLTFGNGMIMLGSINQNEWSRNLIQPEETGHRETATAYLIVHDATALYHRAKAAGASILGELAEASYGGMGFSCADPEGHLWSFGEYDPWQAE